MRTPEKGSLAWLNGRFMTVEHAMIRLDDPAVQSGIGVFETLAVRNGALLDLDAHLVRLERGAACIGVDLPHSETLRDAALRVAASLAPPVGWLKIMAGRHGLASAFAGGIEPKEVGKPSSAVLLRWRRSHDDPLAGLKTLNYAPFILGTEEAVRRGADEGLWLNSRGHLAEGCSSNLVVVWRKKLFTASVRDGVLPGTVRDLALRAASEIGVDVHEGKVRLRRLETAGEAFLTSSVRGIRPLVLYNGRPVGRGEPGPITRRIAELVEKMRKFDSRPRSCGGGDESATIQADAGQAG